MAFNFSPRIVTNGLVLSLDAANPKSYVSGSTVWNDLTANGNSATLTNGPAFDVTNGGNIVFDGMNDYADIVKTMSITYNSFTLCTWFNTTQNADAKIFSINVLNHPLQIYFGKLRVCFDGLCNQGAATINTGNWIMATVVGNPSSIKVFINDSITADITRAASSSTFTVIPSIGKVGDGGSAYNYQGKLSHMIIYNRDLSSQEILQNYNALKGRFGLT